MARPRSAPTIAPAATCSQRSPPPGGRELSSTVRSAAGGTAITDYHINVFYSDDDEGYIADIPDLDACSAFGENPNRAVAEVFVAKEAWLAAAKDNSTTDP